MSVRKKIVDLYVLIYVCTNAYMMTGRSGETSRSCAASKMAPSQRAACGVETPRRSGELLPARS